MVHGPHQEIRPPYWVDRTGQCVLTCWAIPHLWCLLL